MGSSLKLLKMVSALKSARNTVSPVCNLFILLSEKQFFLKFCFNFIKVSVNLLRFPAVYCAHHKICMSFLCPCFRVRH